MGFLWRFYNAMPFDRGEHQSQQTVESGRFWNHLRVDKVTHLLEESFIVLQWHLHKMKRNNIHNPIIANASAYPIVCRHTWLHCVVYCFSKTYCTKKTPAYSGECCKRNKIVANRTHYPITFWKSLFKQFAKAFCCENVYIRLPQCMGVYGRERWSSRALHELWQLRDILSEWWPPIGQHHREEKRGRGSRVGPGAPRPGIEGRRTACLNVAHSEHTHRIER